ncbi:MAG: MBL fold metallo-hydrolase [Clostridia bacterium]|nr:MBL fold metallo-hydrolase [Clostridia bacterium]
MARKKKSKMRKQRIIKGVLTVICLIILAIMWLFFKPAEDIGTPSGSSAQSSGLTDGSTNDSFVPEDGDDNVTPEGSAEIHFIDIGQGDSTLLVSGGKNVLIDTGERDSDNVLLNYLTEQNITVIEYFVITHFDSDHFGEAVEVLDTFDVVNLIIPDQVKTTKMYETFMDKAEEQAQSGDIIVMNANEMIGEQLNVGGMELTVLAPLRNDYSDSNDYSVSLMLRYGNKKALLTGDAEKEAEEDIVAEYGVSELDCDIFKLGHHGSRTSNSQALLDKATPTYVVACCGEGNKYGHPHSEVLERIEGLELYRTDTDGTIIFIIANDIISVQTEK